MWQPWPLEGNKTHNGKAPQDLEFMIIAKHVDNTSQHPWCLCEYIMDIDAQGMNGELITTHVVPASFLKNWDTNMPPVFTIVTLILFSMRECISFKNCITKNVFKMFIFGHFLVIELEVKVIGKCKNISFIKNCEPNQRFQSFARFDREREREKYWKNESSTIASIASNKFISSFYNCFRKEYLLLEIVLPKVLWPL